MKITSVVFGIRFKSFTLKDKLGYYIDSIINNSKIFNGDFFPEVQTGIARATLQNESNGNNIIIDPDNLIFEYYTDNNESIIEYSQYFKNDVINVIFANDAQIDMKINRFGFAIRSILNTEDYIKHPELSKFLSMFSKNDLDGFNFSYNVKTPTPLGIDNSVKQDYFNIIKSYYRENKSKEIKFEYDSQKYFQPTFKDILDIKKQAKLTFESFVRLRLDAFNKDCVVKNEIKK